MPSEIVVKLLHRESTLSQLEVYKQAFNNNTDFESIKEYWEEKHYENPVHSSYIFGAYDGEKLISINAYMPMQYHLNGKTVNVLQSCESGTLPAYQGKGLWSKVVKYAINYFLEEGVYDFLIGFPNYNNSYKGFMKMKWQHDIDVINYIFVVNGKAFLRTVTGKKIPFSRLLEVQKMGLLLPRQYCAVENASYSESASNCAFDLDLSDEFFEWKKRYKHLKILGLEDKKHRSIARCTYALGTYHGERIIILYRIDAIEGSNYKRVYLDALKELIHRHPEVAFIRTWAMPNSEREAIVKKLKFIKSKHHNPFITYLLKDNVVSAEELHNNTNWANITFLDLD